MERSKPGKNCFNQDFQRLTVFVTTKLFHQKLSEDDDCDSVCYHIGLVLWTGSHDCR